MYRSMCFGLKVKFSSWCRWPSWIWPSEENAGIFGRVMRTIVLLNVRRSRISHTKNQISQRLVTELSLFCVK